jgi:hypothetical protein
MRPQWVLTAALVILMPFVSTGCVETKPQPSDAKQTLIGKSEVEVMACAGQPRAVSSRDTVRILTYDKEGGLLEESFPGTKGSRPEGVRHRCTAIITLEHDRVTYVEYRMTPESSATHGHCEEIFRHCGPQ